MCKATTFVESSDYLKCMDHYRAETELEIAPLSAEKSPRIGNQWKMQLESMPC